MLKKILISTEAYINHLFGLKIIYLISKFWLFLPYILVTENQENSCYKLSVI